MAITFPESFELRSGDGEPFDREPSGLIDLDSYRPYLVDNPIEVPHISQGEQTDNSRYRFMYQHLFFRENLYHQTFLPRESRDRRYRALRELSYSQIAMRKYIEDKLHLDKEGDVAYPPEETIDPTLKDYFDLDLIGASVLGIHEIHHPRIIDTWREAQVQPEELSKLSGEDRVGIFEAKLQELFHATEKPRIVPDKIATSALMRLATLLNSPRLKKEAEDRLPADGYFFPLRVPKIGTLRGIAGAVLRDAVGIRTLEMSRIQHQSLQTGVDGVQLAA